MSLLSTVKCLKTIYQEVPETQGTIREQELKDKKPKANPIDLTKAKDEVHLSLGLLSKSLFLYPVSL